jgi:hypothetical protein
VKIESLSPTGVCGIVALGGDALEGHASRFIWYISPELPSGTACRPSCG